MPYTVVKRIGPVNYAIRNSKGLEKVYHRNLIKSALKRLEPKFIATSGAQSEIPTDTSLRVQLPGHSHTGSEQHYGEIILPSIDRQVFTEKRFQMRLSACASSRTDSNVCTCDWQPFNRSRDTVGTCQINVF